MYNDDWSWEQQKGFELALIGNHEDHGDWWERIAAGLAGKTAEQVKGRYDLLSEEISLIEAGLIPIPDYDDEEESFDSGGGNRERRKNPDRKKNEKWTLEQHIAFLWGLAKCGKGDWLHISRHYVRAKTSSQVASHAQKYFLRQAAKKKKRRSIHDFSLKMLMDAAANKPINGNLAEQTHGRTNEHIAIQANGPGGVHPVFQANGSSYGQSIHQTVTDGNPTLNNGVMMNVSLVCQTLQLRNPPSALSTSRPAPPTACSTPVSISSGSFIPLYRTGDPRAFPLAVAPIAYQVPDTSAQSQQMPRI